MPIRWNSHTAQRERRNPINEIFKWETVIALPEDAVVKHVEVTHLKGTKLSKFAGSITGTERACCVAI